MNDMRQITALGGSIEDGSFAIIDGEAGPHDFPPAKWQVVRRVIHANADFEFKDLGSIPRPFERASRRSARVARSWSMSR
jgi:precorrin-8X/cobalt-precorrin-8 methylmutase